MRTSIFLLMIMLLSGSAFCARTTSARSSFPDARQAFSLIPTEIFENTRFPVSEEEKDRLARQGTTDHWTIVENRNDLLCFEPAEPFPGVCLRLFRSERGALAAFCTEDDDGVCISELWYVDRSGHAAPLPLPPEPPAGDFFSNDHPLPGRLSSSCTYCVFDNGLEVLPSFSSDGIPCELEPDNAVYYLWDGRTFIKKIKRIR